MAEFKRGTKLLLNDTWRWVKGDKWAWYSSLSALIFFTIIIVFGISLTENLWLAWLFTVAFGGFNIYSFTKAVEEEKESLND